MSVAILAHGISVQGTLSICSGTSWLASDMAPGVRIVGSKVSNADVIIDASFQSCPAAQAVGIPLVVKREAVAGVPANVHVCVRFMMDPTVGLAPMDWQYGGCLGDAPPVIAARTDGIPFTTKGWALLDDFISAKLSDGPTRVNRLTLVRFLRGNSLSELSRALPLRFPQGISVKAAGLQQAAELNGVVGLVIGRYDNGRIGVKFPDPHGVKALKPECLLNLDGSPADLGDGELEEPEEDCDMDDEDEEPVDEFLETMWGSHDRQMQPESVPVGTHQRCYWTQGIEIHRVKQADGKWKYRRWASSGRCLKC